MTNLDILVPVKNEASNVNELTSRIDKAMRAAKISYRIIFVVDKSTDDTAIKVKELASKYPILVHLKQGRVGKAFSILEAAKLAESQYVVMIDGDLQYPPEAIPEMFKVRENYGLVIGKRITQDYGKIRQLASKVNRLLFGKLILGWDFDTQSGLKLFRRDLLDYLDLKTVGAWSLDAPLIHTALELGYQVGQVDIIFYKRASGKSTLRLFSATANIVLSNLRLRLAPKKIYHLPPTNENSFLGAGVVFKRKRFITHTNLHHDHSALTTLVTWQKTAILIFLVVCALGLVLNPMTTLTVLVAVLTVIYFIDVLFSLYLIIKSLHFPPEITISDKELWLLDSKKLPIYSILCPLYHEAKVLPQFLQNIASLDYPKNKLDVLFLLEEDDTETIEAAKNLDKPNYLRIIIVPNSLPKTKPKACNYGLNLALGQFVVVFDAEDQPDPDQLKKAYLAFQKLPPEVRCVQAKLNYYNPSHNLLTRLFTVEYSLWFDLVLPALQSINTTIPLGGTSNHFRRSDLISLGGWDAFNVTEDCDLGARLFKKGFKTAIIDSTTLEEANSNLKNWIRQRSRWIKGYFQTYLVHNRHPLKLLRDLGWHALIFQLIIGARTTFMLVNPILWAATISYFLFYRYVGPAIESLYPTPIFYMAVFSLVIGNFMYLYNYMIATAKKGQWSLIKFVFLIPFYWLLVSLAAIKAFSQLFFKPHFWEKTIHGYHLEKTKAIAAEEVPVPTQRRWIPAGFNRWSKTISGAALIAATLAANFLNFLGSTFLARAVGFDQLGLISLLGGFLAISDIPIGAFGRTVTYRIGYILGKFENSGSQIWQRYLQGSFLPAVLVTILWVLATPALTTFFQSTNMLPLLMFTPVWIFTVLVTVNSGFLSGNQKFQILALITICEAIFKLLFTVIFVQSGLTSLVYLAMPLSILGSVILSFYFAARIKNPAPILDKNEINHFPSKFYSTSVLLKISGALFLSLDIILAKHFLPPIEAGQYALLSTVGKIVYLFGTQFTQFITPLVSRLEGARQNPKKTFQKILGLTIVVSTLGYLGIGVFGQLTVPFLMGPKSVLILPYLFSYAAIMALLSVGSAIASYYQVRKKYLFPIVSIIVALGQAGAIILFHDTIFAIVSVMLASSLVYLSLMLFLHASYEILVSAGRNSLDFLGLFQKVPHQPLEPLGKLRILVFNWRDTRHVWAGGAEIYIQELAKRWVQQGNQVTIFCGNDGRCPRYETIDGVNIIRRGGFYFVYIWATLYYLFKLRGKFDLVIDCENGTPFFTPFFVEVKKFLLIHHVHQEVFRKSLPAPLASLAAFMEKTTMPIFYRNVQVITVSPSSKSEILLNGLTNTQPEVIYNGIDPNVYKPGKKSDKPLVLYVGRIKDHKSLPVFVRAAKTVLETVPAAQFVIAGDGPDKKPLVKLVENLGLTEQIKFTGHISDQEKISLYQRAWVFVNPSLMEGWGVTSIEANACGTPVVASNVPGLRDSVHNPHSGVLVPYGDYQSFAKEIEILLTNKYIRAQMSREAISWAKKFSWDKSAEEFMEVIKNA